MSGKPGGEGRRDVRREARYAVRTSRKRLRKRDDGVYVALDPQLDDGTFSVRQDHVANPTAWVWKPQNSHYEVWALYRPGQPNGFRKPGGGVGTATRLRLAWNDVQFGNADPVNPANISLFLQYAVGNSIEIPNVGPQDFTLFACRAIGQAPGSAAASAGVLQPGYFDVFDAVGDLMACAWHPQDLFERRETWVLRGLPSPYQYPGSAYPNVVLTLVQRPLPNGNDPNSGGAFYDWAIARLGDDSAGAVEHRLDEVTTA